MTFWQENYGFVKEVYDFRCSKYTEWMDNIEAIIAKVMANTQYTAKEFKIIKDTFTSLCRDLAKQGTKSWLDMMLDKLSSSHSQEEENLSGRDKAVKAQEKKKLEAMVERHNGLMAPTKEAQSKVQHYSECYAYGDDMHPVMKILNEQCHLCIKEIHPHNMEMCEEQIEKQEKVIRTIDNQATLYRDLMKRGEKLKNNPNAPAFLEKEMARLNDAWKETNDNAKIRRDLLNSTFKDWDIYEAKRVEIIIPLETLEEQYKTYRKVYDPKKGADWLERKKKKADDLIKYILETYEILKKSFATIKALAGEEKKDYMEKEVNEIDEKKLIVEKVQKALEELRLFNMGLTKGISGLAELRAWMMPAQQKLDFITTTTDLSPEDRVKEIFDLQGQVNERLPLLEPLEKEIHQLLDAPDRKYDAEKKEGTEGTEEEEGGQTSETALRHIAEFETVKSTVTELHERIEVEAGSITQDQRHFADYLLGVKTFKPWMDEAENVVKVPICKPATLEEVKSLLEASKIFNEQCQENKGKLDSASESRGKMEKQTKADTEVDKLNGRWNDVKKISSSRVEKTQLLCETWTDLQNLTESLTLSITNIPGEDTPDISALEEAFKKFREINANKLKLLNGL